MSAVLKQISSKPQGGLRSSIETVTPKLAKEWLTTAVSNRPVSQALVIEYAIAMDEGRWSVNGETIKFDDKGQLFDGQHRLQACVLAEKAFVTHVVRDINDPDAFATVDAGKTRTHADIFSLDGFGDSSHAAGVAMIVYLYKNGLLTLSGPTGRRYKRGTAIAAKIKSMPTRRTHVDKDTLIAYARTIRTEIAAALAAAYETGLKKHIAPLNVVAGCYYLCAEKSKLDAGVFFGQLASGANLQPTDPVHMLRERLAANAAEAKSSGKRMTRWMMIALILKAWNKHRAGEKVRSLRIIEGEEFPKVI